MNRLGIVIQVSASVFWLMFLLLDLIVPFPSANYRGMWHVTGVALVVLMAISTACMESDRKRTEQKDEEQCSGS